MLLVWPQLRGEAGRQRDRGDLGLAAKASRVGLDRGGVLPARRQQVFEVEHAGRFGIRQQQASIRGATRRIDQVGHHREQAPDALRRKFEDPAVIETRDQFAIDDPRRVVTAPVEHARKDRQQRDPGAVDLDPEIEREFARLRIGDSHVIIADHLDVAGSEIPVDQVAPAERLERRHAIVDEALPTCGSVAAALDIDHAALRRRAFGDPDLIEPGLVQDIDRGGLAGAVAAHEALVSVGIARPLHAERTGAHPRRARGCPHSRTRW